MSTSSAKTSPPSAGSAASSASARADSAVRPFAAEDIPQVADLHRRVFRTAGPDTPGWRESYRRYLREAFLPDPAGGGALSSLVGEDRSGRVVGFLGVVPRRLVFRGQPIVMALCSQFVVDPSARGRVGLRMIRHCLAGPQDLTLTDEAEPATEAIWQWCGGTTALLPGVRWIRPLRPARAALALVRKRTRLAWALRAAVPAAALLDALIIRSGPAPFRITPPRGSREELDAATILDRLPELAGDRALRPAYDAGSLRWMLERAGGLRGHGDLRSVLVRDEARRVIGWFVYYVDRGGVGEVLQIASQRRARGQVLDHLLDDAARHALAALAGRLDPPAAQEMSERHFLLYRRGFSMLVHSSRPELTHAVLRGDAFLSRLDGEWCLHYQ